MQVVHISSVAMSKPEKKKKVPLWKDPVAKANFRLDFAEQLQRQYEKLKHEL